MYAIAFKAHTKEVIEHYKITSRLQGRNLYACCWIFMVELCLIALIFWQVIIYPDHFLIFTPTKEVYICRFLATFLLHMELIEDVKQGLTMLNYLNTHPNEFNSTTVPFLIAFMQMSGGLLAELTNLFMLATRSTVEYCITFFVAFHVLTAIDNIYAEGISGFHLLHTVEEPLVFKTRPKDIKFSSRTPAHKAIRVLWLVCEFFYNTVYYYYLPFAVNFVPYFAPGDPETYVAH